MAYNVPSYETDRFAFGPGILYMGAPGATPLIDVGAVKGDAEFSIQRTRLEVKQGSPQTLVKSYTIDEKVTLKVTGIEWNFDNLVYAMGAGNTSVSGADEILEFGGDPDTNSRALRYVHIAPDGSTIDIHIFDAEGAGDLAIAFKETDMHEFPFEFTALEGSVDFEGAALADTKKQFKIIRTKV
jgi:hypothetical protein